MRKILFTIALAAVALQVSGQTKAENIASPIISEQDSAYYAEQTRLWRKIAHRAPNDENAWKNYFRAAWYNDRWYNNTDSTSDRALHEIKEAIPDSYVFYYASYRKLMGTLDSHQYAVEAMKRLPDNMDQHDYDTWFCYAAQVGDEKNMERIAKMYYESGIYSPAVLQYSFNEMQGMEHGGIYIGNGDAIVIPKWMLQYAKGLHRDKIILCLPFLAIRQYREYIFSKLGIEMPQFRESKSQADYDANIYMAVEALRKGSHRAAYFSPVNGGDINKPWESKLYNEGLILKYSDTPYDSFTVKRRNVEQNYMLEYLIESFTPNTWSSGNRLNGNYVVMLSDLLKYYKKNNQTRYKWLYKILSSALENSNIDGERAARMKELIN